MYKYIKVKKYIQSDDIQKPDETTLSFLKSWIVVSGPEKIQWAHKSDPEVRIQPDISDPDRGRGDCCQYQPLPQEVASLIFSQFWAPHFLLGLTSTLATPSYLWNTEKFSPGVRN